MAGKTATWWIFGAVMLFVSCTVPAADTPPPLRYDIALRMRQDTLDHVEVSATTRTDAHGVADFIPPAQEPAAISAAGGRLDRTTQGHWRVIAAPGTEVTLRWQSHSASPSRTLGDEPWRHVLVRPDAVIVASGGALLPFPVGSQDRNVEVHWTAPASWIVSTTLHEGVQPLTQLVQGNYMAAAHATTVMRGVGDHGQVHVTGLGDHTATAAPTAEAIARLVSHALPNAATDQPLVVNLVDVEAPAQVSASVSDGNATTVYQGRDGKLADWLLYAIDNFATPVVLPAAHADAWYVQGFAAFRLSDAIRRDPALGPSAFARRLDVVVTSYGNSPMRRAPNAQIVADYDRVREAAQLPRLRGELFAWLLDGRIRTATGGRASLQDALTQMDGHARGGPGEALIAAVAATGGGDIRPLYQRYIEEGQLLQLPNDALGACYPVGTVSYDYGWEVQHVSARTGCTSD